MRTGMRITAAVIISLYFFLLIFWMFFGFGRSVYIYGYAYNIVPFATINQYLFNYESYNLRTWMINLFGNIGVFLPFGICIPYVLKLRGAVFMILFLAGITMLELAQMFSRRGSFDIDDIILNSLGAFIGFLIYKLAKRAVSGKLHAFYKRTNSKKAFLQE